MSYQGNERWSLEQCRVEKFYAESSSGRIDISDHFGVSACFTADPMLDLQFWNEKSNKPEDGERSLIALQNTHEVLMTAMSHVQQKWFQEKRIVGLCVVAFVAWQILAALYWSYGKWGRISHSSAPSPLFFGYLLTLCTARFSPLLCSKSFAPWDNICHVNFDVIRG